MLLLLLLLLFFWDVNGYLKDIDLKTILRNF